MIGVLLREDRSDLSIMNYECYMLELDASAEYNTVLVGQTKPNREWTWN